MRQRFCPHCEAARPVKAVRKEKSLRVKDLDIPVSIETFVCDTCEKAFATQSQEEGNLQRAYKEYRKRGKIYDRGFGILKGSKLTEALRKSRQEERKR